MRFFDSFIKFLNPKKKPYMGQSLNDWARTEYKDDSDWALSSYQKSGKFPKGNRTQNEIRDRKNQK